MKQERVQKTKTARREDPTLESGTAHTNIDAFATEAGLKDILDEIDDVLESNAEAFVAGYIQKNGE
jgi:ubiquitin-like protein Pup